ncbi:MAG: helix-turn-helix domain-containing protein [Spirochaetia bacterium]|nr:helix-turn-helix domain-containing protein [Spirochaetia bacterium]
MALDPIFNLFQIPLSSDPAKLDKIFYRPTESKICFRPATERIGLYPVLYRQTFGKMRPHTHDFFEIFLVVEGQGVHLVEGREIALAPRDLVFVDNQKLHAIHPRGRNLRILNLCFLPTAIGYDDRALKNESLLDFYTLLSPFKATDREHQALLLKLPEDLFRKILFESIHMVELFFQDAERNQEALRHRLKATVLLLFDEFRRTRPKEAGGRVFLFDALRYIQEHFSEKISVGKIAGHYGISKTYFSTLFNRLVGKNINEYVNDYRIARARELLAETRLPVSAIASETGFDNVSHFNFVFKKLERLAPGEYRKRRA